MKMKVYKKENETRKIIGEFKLKNSLDGFDAIRSVYPKLKEVITLPDNARMYLGIGNISCKGLYSTTFIENKGDWQEPVAVDSDVYLGFEFFKEGFVLNCGKKAYNIFGGASNAYFKSIGTRNIHFSNISNSRIFNNAKALFGFLEKHKNNLIYIKKKDSGYNFTIEFTCPQFEESYKMSKKEQEYMKQAEQLLDEINSIEEETEEYEGINIDKEILYRMKSLNLYGPVVTNFFKSNKLYQSEYGGILYDLDDISKRAVEKVRELGYTPYHVIAGKFVHGEVRDVLFVSESQENWQSERLHNGQLTSLCYMQEYDDFEIGTIGITPANGGVVRTA